MVRHDQQILPRNPGLPTLSYANNRHLRQHRYAGRGIHFSALPSRVSVAPSGLPTLAENEMNCVLKCVCSHDLVAHTLPVCVVATGGSCEAVLSHDARAVRPCGR